MYHRELIMNNYPNFFKKRTSIVSGNGFSLIEVLIALVILSVGMLGVLTLQVKGLQFSQSARVSTNAILAASDMADRIRNASPEDLERIKERMKSFGLSDEQIEETITSIRGEGSK